MPRQITRSLLMSKVSWGHSRITCLSKNGTPDFDTGVGSVGPGIGAVRYNPTNGEAGSLMFCVRRCNNSHYDQEDLRLRHLQDIEGLLNVSALVWTTGVSRIRQFGHASRTRRARVKVSLRVTVSLQ